MSSIISKFPESPTLKAGKTRGWEEGPVVEKQCVPNHEPCNSQRGHRCMSSISRGPTGGDE